MPTKADRKETLKTSAHPKVRVQTKRALGKEQLGADKESMTSVRKSVLFLGAVAIVYTLYLIFSGQWGAFIDSMRNIDSSWVVGAALMYVGYFSLGTLAYVCAVVGDKKSPVGLRDLMSVEAAGVFFSKLTPNGTGGAPAQIFRLTRAGLSMGQAGALQYTRFIVYEASEGIFAALMLLFRGQYFIDTYGDVVLIGALLFGFKIFEVAGLLLICLKPNLVIKLAQLLVRLLRKSPLAEKTKHFEGHIFAQVHDFADGFREAAANIGGMAITLLITLAQLACQYILPYFILRAFNLPADILTCLAAGSMIELLTSAIPLPGGTGGAEGGFAFLFQYMFGQKLAAAYVIWRMVEYFLPILASVPFLGLRSTSGVTLYTRWNRIKAHTKRIYLRLVDPSAKLSSKDARSITISMKKSKSKTKKQ